jgi:uncharacterized protein YeaC (DUF1315 family)
MWFGRSRTLLPHPPTDNIHVWCLCVALGAAFKRVTAAGLGTLCHRCLIFPLWQHVCQRVGVGGWEDSKSSLASDKRQQLMQEVLLWHVALYFSKKGPTLFFTFTSQYVLTEKFPFKTDWREHIEPHIAQASHVSTRRDLDGRPCETWPYKAQRPFYNSNCKPVDCPSSLI